MNYIWDLDGTLIDSYPVIVSSLTEVAANAGIQDLPNEILKAVKQGSVSGYLRELSRRTGAVYETLYEEYRRISHAGIDQIGLIPGAIETLQGLKERGARHFLYTHRGTSTGKLLSHLGLSTMFEETVTWENGFPPKPDGKGVRYLVEKYHLNPEQTAYVGDRKLDVQCARDAGVKAILFKPEDSCVEPTGIEDRIIKSLESLLEQEPEKQHVNVPTLIELYDERPLENVLGVEVCHPSRVIYICSKGIEYKEQMQNQLKTYFEHRKIPLRLNFVYANPFDTENMVETFSGLIRKYPDSAIDITGGTDAILFAAGLVCGAQQIPVITYSRRNKRFYNIRNAEFAGDLNCNISFSVEDTFLMAGGTMRKGRVDNSLLNRYFSLYDPFFDLYLKHRRAWDRIVSWMQRASAADKEGGYSLEIECDYSLKIERGSKIDAPEEALKDMEALGMIRELTITPGETVSFQFQDAQIRAWLRDVGSVLELKAYKACVDTGLFNEVLSSAVVDWDASEKMGKVSNELDVMATRGIVPLFISCKTCAVRTEAINELAVLRDRFGGSIAKAAIISAEYAGAAARNRAQEMNIHMIDLGDLQADCLRERIEEIMNSPN